MCVNTFFKKARKWQTKFGVVASFWGEAGGDGQEAHDWANDICNLLVLKLVGRSIFIITLYTYIYI